MIITFMLSVSSYYGRVRSADFQGALGKTRSVIYIG